MIPIKVSPSSLPRVMVCGASAVEAANYDDPPGLAAEIGTEKHHALMLAHIHGDSEADSAIASSVLIKDHRDALNQVLTAKGQMLKLWGGKAPDDLQVERKLNMNPLGMPPTGRENEWQADYSWTDDKHGHVLDYKSGTTEYAAPDENDQGFSYLSRMVIEDDLEGGYFHICQPQKFGSVQSSKFISREQLEKWSAGVTHHLKALKSGLAVYSPSPEACGWCPARRDCEAAKGQTQERKDARDSVKAEALALGDAGGEALQVRTGLPEFILALDDATVREANKLEASANMYDVITADNQEEVGRLLNLITKTEKVVEDRRKLGKKPILDLSAAWDGAFKEAGAPLARAKDGLKTRFETYVREVNRLAAEANAKIEAERIAHEKAVALAEKKGKAAPPPPPPSAPVPAPVSSASVKITKVKMFKLKDLEKVPKQYLLTTANEPIIAAAVKAGQIPIGENAWIKVWIEDKVSSK